MTTTKIGVMYKHTFTAEGGGAFPLDMLRYDRCHPETSDDVAAIDTGGTQNIRRVTLVKYSTDRKWAPTWDRWNSFLWREGFVRR